MRCHHPGGSAAPLPSPVQPQTQRCLSRSTGLNVMGQSICRTFPPTKLGTWDTCTHPHCPFFLCGKLEKERARTQAEDRATLHPLRHSLVLHQPRNRF